MLSSGIFPARKKRGCLRASSELHHKDRSTIGIKISYIALKRRTELYVQFNFKFITPFSLNAVNKQYIISAALFMLPYGIAH